MATGFMYSLLDILFSDFFMNDLFYYKGLYKVKVVTKSEGYFIVEALEDFDDTVDSEKVKVKVGERRIVLPEELHKKKALAPPIPEHVYERKLEKKVKRMVEEYDSKEMTDAASS
jgi:hypothetical protein